MSPLTPPKARLIWGHMVQQWHFEGQSLWAHFLQHEVKNKQEHAGTQKKKVCNRCLLSFHQWLRLRWIIWYYFPDVMRKKSPSKVSIASSGASKWNQLINNFTNETENQQRLSSFNASFRQGYTTTTSLSLTRNVLLSTVGPVELYELNP